MILSITTIEAYQEGYRCLQTRFRDTSFVIESGNDHTWCGFVCFPLYEKNPKSFARNAGYLYAFCHKYQRERPWKAWLTNDLHHGCPDLELRNCAVRYFDYYRRVL